MFGEAYTSSSAEELFLLQPHNEEDDNNICFNNSSSRNAAVDFSFPVAAAAPPDFLASVFPNGKSSLLGSGGMVYDHEVGLLPLKNLLPPPEPPLLRNLFQFDGNGGGGGVEDGVFENEMMADCCVVRNRNRKHFATEKHRRVLLNDKYEALKKLIPNPTKTDRASTVADAISYIQELKRTVAELKVLLEKKRSARERRRKPKSDEENRHETTVKAPAAATQGDGACNDDDSSSSSLRTSWLQRKSKHTEVDVRIIDDEVTVKVVQQKRINCLLFVSRLLDELRLDLHHVAGGLIGDYYSFLFNSKICEGSIVYASSLANKVIEVVDLQHASILRPSME